MSIVQLPEMTRRVFLHRTLQPALLPGFGRDHKRFTSRMRSTSITALLVPDQPSGQVSDRWTDDGQVVPRIDYAMTEEWKQLQVRGMKMAGELLFAADFAVHWMLES